jgi:hypothetical protein
MSRMRAPPQADSDRCRAYLARDLRLSIFDDANTGQVKDD